MNEKYIDIVFDAPPGPEPSNFIEVEDSTGKSIKFGEWVQQAEGGYWALRIPDLRQEVERLQEMNSEAADLLVRQRGDINKAEARLNRLVERLEHHVREADTGTLEHYPVALLKQHIQAAIAEAKEDGVRDELFDELVATREEVERLLMSRARKDAMLAVYMQAIASEARKGRDGWAQGIVHRAEEAALRVKRSDLTIATVSAEARGE